MYVEIVKNTRAKCDRRLKSVRHLGALSHSGMQLITERAIVGIVECRRTEIAQMFYKIFLG